MPAQALSITTSIAYSPAFALRVPADGSLLLATILFADLSSLAVGASVGGEGQFFHSLFQWRGVLKPSSAPLLGVIQDMRLNDTHKGREVFSEVGSMEEGRGLTELRLFACVEE